MSTNPLTHMTQNIKFINLCVVCPRATQKLESLYRN